MGRGDDRRGVTNNEHVDVYDDRDEETTLHSRGQYLQHPTSSAKDGDDEFEDDEQIMRRMERVDAAREEAAVPPGTFSRGHTRNVEYGGTLS